MSAITIHASDPTSEALHEPPLRPHLHPVLDSDASQRFYGALGFEPRGRLNFATAYNLYLGLPGDRDDLPRIAFVADPDGCRIELLDGGRFDTPQD